MNLFADDRPKEECGVVGLYSPGSEAARLAFFSLFALQHRGQESAGIAVSDGSRVRMEKGMGLVNQVFDEHTLNSLTGDSAIGHTRYSTFGASVMRNAQPIHCTSEVGDIAVAHNGNLINAHQVRCELEDAGEPFQTTADSELIARLLARHIKDGPEAAVEQVMTRLKGAYSVCAITPRCVFGFCDPYGVRPMSVGRLQDGHMIASESCAFTPVNAEVIREVAAGEVAIIDRDGLRFHQFHLEGRPAMCLFEFIYFARPDSRMYGTLLYKARERMGHELAKEHPVEADVVIPVPDSGIPAAHGFADASGIPFAEGMMKSRYIHRTFIQPTQELREMGVRMKLAPMAEHVEGRRIVLVDDSIVRGTTTKQIVRLLFESGAKEVHVRVTAPPIRHPCFYGIDMATQGELAAARMSVEEIGRHIGATSLGYLSIEGAVRATGGSEDRFCLACFNGDYPIPIPRDIRRDAFEEEPDVGQIATVVGGQRSLF